MLGVKDVAMKLLELPDGMLSLEFQASERDTLLAGLKKFGPVKGFPQASYDTVSVGKEKFIHENEWDDPCLISTTQAGAEMLRQLVSKPVRSKAA